MGIKTCILEKMLKSVSLFTVAMIKVIALYSILIADWKPCISLKKISGTKTMFYLLRYLESEIRHTFPKKKKD